ncbi:hypothetical protein [Enterococcus phage phiFL2A]|uniref:Uncharacterized protein gp05 n=1 Tax=Enterococcus phage phiFL2A TaxID=673835 RepID=D2IZC5_9CAUD|nr:hypothetical protein EP-phiFL2A_gp05 [Enterococcus phage phiFL2A]ACZ63902.1 hypothetical protein [Enterococcus phage phiFL2A]
MFEFFLLLLMQLLLQVLSLVTFNHILSGII